jgi:hypothetical protein
MTWLCKAAIDRLEVKRGKQAGWMSLSIGWGAPKTPVSAGAADWYLSAGEHAQRAVRPSSTPFSG